MVSVDVKEHLKKCDNVCVTGCLEVEVTVLGFPSPIALMASEPELQQHSGRCKHEFTNRSAVLPPPPPPTPPPP